MLTGKRFEIAAALSGVPGVKGHEKRPANPAEGDAWPMLPVLDRGPGDAFMATWGVRVVPPQDEVAAADWFDQLWPAIYYALKPVLSVQRATPIAVPTSAGDLLMFEITGTAEE